MQAQISQLPTRYEALVERFGAKAQTTIVPPTPDLEAIKRLVQSVKSAGQGKMVFLFGQTGQGKTTFIESLSLFLGDQIGRVIRIPPSFELPISGVVSFAAKTQKSTRLTVLNFDGREAPFFNEAEYKNFLIELNSFLRGRKDIVVIWPVNDRIFADKIVELMNAVAGKSAFGPNDIQVSSGIDRSQYIPVLEKINQIANWRIEDAALSRSEVEKFRDGASSVGDFLDRVHGAIVQRFDVSSIGVELPNLVFVISSGKKEVKELCRSIRRADSYYLEASRLLMYTKRSNVAEWWEERNKDMRTNLNYIIALFNGQLLSISGSSVVHAVRNYGTDDLRTSISDITKNIGNAKRVIQASELFRYSNGQDTDAREYGLNAKDETLAAYESVQALSKESHKSINTSIMALLSEAGGGFDSVLYEQRRGSKAHILADVCAQRGDERVHIEFHHKSERESTSNKLAIYILEKVKEYSIAYGLCKP